MNTKISLPLALLFSISTLFAQKREPLINSGELIEKGSALHDKGQYKEAIELYKKISRSDTNYDKALYELAFSYYQDSNFIESKKYAEIGLKLFPVQENQWLLQIANAEDELGNKEKAISCYQKVLTNNKFDFITWFNLGLTYYRMKNYTEAKKNLQQCLMLNPFYSSAHYYLGNICFEEGKPVQALLSYCCNLVVNPENRYYNNSIVKLSTISEAKDELIKNISKSKKSKEDNFELIQEILISKISFDKGYKLQSSLEDHITRQIQVVMEKLEYNSSDKGFWMQFYVPLFKKIFEENKFNNFSYYIFSNLTNKTINDYVKRNKKGMEDVSDLCSNYLSTIRETQTLQADKRDAVETRYIVSNRLITGKGKWIQDGKNTKALGAWEFYHDNGKISAKGKFDDNGLKQGEWQYFYKSGILKEKNDFSAGKLNGKVYSWFDNGVLASETDYKNNEPDGVNKVWYYNGILKKIEHYSNGKLNGNVKGFTNYGYLSYDASFENDLENGTYTTYHENGVKLSHATYSAGKANGEYKKYFDDGKLQWQGALENGKKIGLWKEYYNNGSTKTEYTYVNDQIDGQGKEYHENGQLAQVSNYTKGKLEGKVEDFDDDGKITCESLYEKGRLREIKFIDKTGKVISNTTTKRGAATLIFYDAFGNKTSEGFFTKEGMRDGKTFYYYSNGKISSESDFKNGLLQGNKKEYFITGALSSEAEYNEDEEDGYYVSYFPTGKLKYEGWFVKGKKQGEHIEYDALGNVKTKVYYLNGENDGYFENYFPDGKLDYETKYESGWITHVTQFNADGKIMEDVNLPKGEGNFTFKLANGNPYIIGSYANFHLHGSYQIKYFDGTTAYSYSFYQGNYDSTYKSYYYGGKIKMEGSYKRGLKVGTWKVYHANGQLNYADNYDINGKLNGVSVLYREDGSKEREINYKNSVLSGAYKQYGENNKLAFQINYLNGKIISYTYEGKDGKLLPPITVNNGTFKMLAYYSNGTKSAEYDFLEHQLTGARKVFFSTGKPYIEGTRLMGDDEGPKKVFYPNGNIEEESNFVNDELHGLFKSYYSNGKLKCEENYYLGNQHGKCLYFDETGKLKQTRIYYYGILQQIL